MTTKKKSLHVEKSRLEIDISQMVADHLDVPDVLSTNQIRLITEAIMHDLAPLIRAGASMRTYVGPPRCDEDMAVAWDTAAQHLKECP